MLSIAVAVLHLHPHLLDRYVPEKLPCSFRRIPAAFTVMSYLPSFVICNQTPLVRVQMEVDEVLGKKNEVTEEDLDKLQFTEQVVLVFTFSNLGCMN